MKNKIKKLLTTTIISAVSATAIGCSSGNSKLAKNIDNGMSEFVSSINNLDYVETSAQAASNDKLGKIVETVAYPTKTNLTNYLSESISDSTIENTITRPSERTDNFKLYVLSESPYVSFTSDDNSASFNMYVKFSTNKIEETSDEIDSKINSLILKRSILMIYVNEIYNGNVTITEENRTAINAYVNVIKENASFLKGNRGMVKNQLNLASDLLNNESNENLVNYYIIKSGEALETRSSKIDSTLSAITSIIGILENNLTPNSPYYNTRLSSSYESLLNNTNSSTNQTISSENKQLADNIAESLNLKLETNNTSTQSTQNSNNTTNSQEPNISAEQNNSSENNQNENTYNVKNLNINTPNSENLEINNITNGNTRSAVDTNFTNHPSYHNSLSNQQSTTNSNTLNNQLNNPNTQTLNSEQQNQSQNTIKTRSINNTKNTTNNERNSSTTSRTRRSTRINTRTQTHTRNPQTTQVNESNQNQAKSVNNMDNQNRKIMRADRTQETPQTEQYNASKQNYTGHERAERVPYTTTTTFNQ